MRIANSESAGRSRSTLVLQDATTRSETSGNPKTLDAIDSTAFTSALSAAANGVSIVSTAHQGRRAGLTVSSMCSVCAEPPLLLACVMADNEFCALADAGGHFTINILSQSHVEVAMTFAGLIEDDKGERFDTGIWTTGKSGSPVLSDALVALECRLDSAATHGTHRIYIGEVIDVHTTDGQPLVYTARGFANTTPLS